MSLLGMLSHSHSIIFSSLLIASLYVWCSTKAATAYVLKKACYLIVIRHTMGKLIVAHLDQLSENRGFFIFVK